MGKFKSYLRFATGLHGHFSRSVDLEDATETVRLRLKERGARFIKLLDRGVFGYSRSPYLPLLRSAGLSLNDVAQVVRTQGLEASLDLLRSEGVSISFEEFKGRSKQARQGMQTPLTPGDFDNPYLSSYYTGTTGGSSGAGTRVLMDLEHYSAQSSQEYLATQAHDLLDTPTAAWLSVMPSPASFGVMLRRVPFRRPLAKWFSQTTPREAGARFQDRLASRTLFMASNTFGQPFPRPEHVPLENALHIAKWLRSTADSRGSSALVTHVSCAARVAVAALKDGVDLNGVTMWAGSEPPTPAKVSLIRQAGAHFIPGYWMIETGFMAQGCTNPLDDTDVHLFTDAFAITTHQQNVPGTKRHVDAFYLTTLLPSAPKLMINVEIDDSGILEKRSCGCPLEKFGYDVHLRQIHGLRKFTGEGMTLLGGAILEVLETVLPRQCGGTALDYQLAEEEDASGLTRLILIVSPDVALDDNRIRQVFLSALDQYGPGATLAGATWRQADSVLVRREKPRATGQGKLMPLQPGESKQIQ